MLDEYYQFRRHLVDALERDLLGPESPDEVITDPPITKYIAGVLFPRDSDRSDPAQDLGDDADSDADADDSEPWDPAVSMSYVRYPSSMGMTMAVDTAATQLITVRVGGARYVPVEHEGSEAKPVPEGADDARPGCAGIDRQAGEAPRTTGLAQGPARNRARRDRRIETVLREGRIQSATAWSCFSESAQPTS